MKKRMICLLLACLMLVGMLAACGEGDEEEMTAVTLETEATETTAATEATEATEVTEATEATEKKTEPTSKATEAPTEPATEPATEAYRPPVVTQPVVTPPVTEAPPPATEAPTEAPPTEPAPTDPAPDLRSLAMGCIGCDVSVLYATIGYPNGSSYASSCMGDGEDGELYYNGFTVYTYRENGVETVQSVY